ncbi:polysaccharide pyruvyl transferase [Sphingomonas sp. BK036]|uniref:polysaccharide pyruvyl transferase family protein n=1 Tax=Sphingomonas sp. BK036 TaxID=2512122 RepID=UPI0010ECA9A5|nr:polysaccharide pyruvyl transferase family protein [Sphingomonas sp. BK036]RZT56677.1 polysaccharide pyruvyl transferase [Sphingomonas sp. BK036]
MAVSKPRRRVAILPNLSIRQLGDAGRVPTADAATLTEALGGNAGNVAYVDGLVASLADSHMITWSTPPEIVRATADIIVVACANQLGDHVDLAGWAARLAAFGLPVLLVGLGAQAPGLGASLDLKPGTRAALDVVAAAAGAAPAMLVRGAYTAEILARNGYASTIIGCPSLFLSPTRDLGARIAARVAAGLGPRPAIAAGHQHHADMAPEHRLIAAAERDDGCYVVQHPATMIALARSDPADMQSAEFAMLAQRLLPGLTPAQVVAWGRRRAFVFTDSQNWMSFLRRYDYAIGPRFHGVALAIQAERPGVVLHVDSRTREMAETMAIPTQPFDDAPLSDLRDVVANAWTPGTGAAFDTRRETLARVFRTALEAHDITVSARLAALSR